MLYVGLPSSHSVSAFGMQMSFEGSMSCLHEPGFPDNILGHIHVSWLDPCKIRRLTIVGSKKMVVYNDIAASEKIKIYR